MQTPTRKTEILDQIHATRQPLEEALAQLDATRMTEPGVNGEWSVKDVLAHVAWWEQLRAQSLRTGSDDVYMEGVDLNASTDQVNAQVFAANHDRPLAGVRADFDAAHRELLSAIEALSDDELASEDTYEAIAWDTFRHYPEHTAMLTDWIEATANGGA